jgi:hypothetical protein
VTGARAQPSAEGRAVDLLLGGSLFNNLEDYGILSRNIHMMPFREGYFLIDGMTISEQLLYSTIRVECLYKNGSRGSGTGFFFRFLEERNSNFVPVIITNNHVINDSQLGALTFTKTDINGNPLDKEHVYFPLPNFESLWIKHPDNRVDLCAMPIGPIIEQAKSQNETIFLKSFGHSLLPSEEQLSNLTALEDVIMIGYPNGIWDSINNKPLFRKGITATHPFHDYNGKKEFMIDAACYPGSSGSPVFILNEFAYSDKQGTYLGKPRLLLLCILYAGPQYTATGEIQIINVPTVQKPIVVSSIPNNLGLVIKSQRITELEQFCGSLWNL